MTSGSQEGVSLFAAWSRPSDRWSGDASLLASHVSFLQDLERQGVTFLSGPLGLGEDGWSGHGLTIIRAASLAAARELLAAEPFIAAGERLPDVMPWLITSGRITASMKISDAGSTVQ